MSLIVPTIPDNMRWGGGAMPYVESDVFDIARRVKELDPNLRIVLHDGHAKPWVVVEIGPDGQERFVSRYEELDERIIKHLRYMLAVPFEKRLAELERQEKINNDALGYLSEERMERFQRDFLDAGVKSGILTPKWSVNRPLKPKRRK